MWPSSIRLLVLMTIAVTTSSIRAEEPNSQQAVLNPATVAHLIAPNDPSLAKSLQLWLRADLFQLKDGQPVMVWPDASGHGHDLTPTLGVRTDGVGKPPAFVKHSDVNRHPAVRFGPESGLAGSPDHPLDIKGDAAFTMILVAKLRPNNHGHQYDCVLFVGNPAGINRKDPGKPLAALIEIERKDDRHQLDLAGGWGHDASLGPGSAKPLYEQPRTLTIIKTPGPMSRTTHFFLDGRNALEAFGRQPTGTEAVPDIQHRDDVGVSMGRVLSWAGSFQGDVCEVIIYNRALTEVQRRGVEQSLAVKYGISTEALVAHADREFSDEEKAYWAFQPIQDVQPPVVKHDRGSHAGLDAFVLARLQSEGIAPAKPADRRTLIRRATYDLIGLPPTPEHVEQFVRDSAPDETAFARVVDRLLASPHYGERWGRHWLDVVRYADTTANDGNFVMQYAFRYRDYVINSFNQDKPYDQFVIEQLAGDLLPPDENPDVTASRIIATGFLMIGPKALAEPDKEQVRMDIVDEQIDVTSRVFLGLTVACARCHDHKFDPIPTVDYYSLAGIFRSVEMFSDLNRNASKWMEFPVKLGAGRKPIMVMAPKEATARDVRVHLRGDRFQLGHFAPRRFLQIIAGEGHEPLRTAASGRLELARWIASRNNPLTARVMVNRIWQGHFGKGLVATSDNFGVQGRLPTHPRLLDWLAARLVESGWSVKAMHRLLMLSRTYRMSSRPNQSSGGKDVLAADPAAALLSRMPRRRLDAEQIRDALLSTSGQLNDMAGGDSLIVKLFEKAEKINNGKVASASTLTSHWEGFDTPCRTVYLPVIRNGQPDFLTLFDGADANAVTPVRNETTVASQTSFLLNNPFVRKQAGHFAERLFDAADANDNARLARAYQLCYARPPTADELASASEYLNRYANALQSRGKDNNAARKAAWHSYCHLLICANEFLYLE